MPLYSLLRDYIVPLKAYGVACSGRDRSLSKLFAALARTGDRHKGDFNTQDLATTAWAFAKAASFRLLKGPYSPFEGIYAYKGI